MLSHTETEWSRLGSACFGWTQHSAVFYFTIYLISHTFFLFQLLLFPTLLFRHHARLISNFPYPTTAIVHAFNTSKYCCSVSNKSQVFVIISCTVFSGNCPLYLHLSLRVCVVKLVEYWNGRDQQLERLKKSINQSINQPINQ
jgi:hypothetical protein